VHHAGVAGAREPQRPRDLGEHDALVYSLSATGARWTLSKGDRTETVRVSGPLKANSSLALHQALHRGLGLARVPWFIAGEDLRRGRLAQVLPEWSLPVQGIHALAAGAIPQKTRVFIAFLRARIGDPPYWER
jgi:DNA-binding transcriptional LysR family regulator